MRLASIAIPIGLIAIGILFYFLLGGDDKAEQQKNIYTTVKKSDFVIPVLATGELKAKNSMSVRGPSEMQSVNVYETTISQIIPEGTKVKKGDFVAQLDQTPLATKISELKNELDKVQTQLEQALIDTTIEMRNLREQIKDLEYTIQEKKIQMELNRFEPQAILRQNQLDYEKAERELKKNLSSFKLSQEKAEAKIREIMTTKRQAELNMNSLNDVSQKFTITAPSEGMIIYRRSWNGTKIGPGSQVNAWNPVVAELPDLSDMIVQAFVNEVDINKVDLGMEVKIKVDALPDRTYSGHILSVANIGENYRNYDSKVFEITVQLNENDSLVRPAMTCGLEIITDTFQNVLNVPLEAIFRDSLTYVYLDKNGSPFKQEVLPGDINDDGMMILLGLQEGQNVYLNEPADAEKVEIGWLNKVEKEKVLSDYNALKVHHKKVIDERKATVKREGLKPTQGGGSSDDFVIIF